MYILSNIPTELENYWERGGGTSAKAVLGEGSAMY